MAISVPRSPASRGSSTKWLSQPHGHIIWNYLPLLPLVSSTLLIESISSSPFRRSSVLTGLSNRISRSCHSSSSPARDAEPPPNMVNIQRGGAEVRSCKSTVQTTLLDDEQREMLVGRSRKHESNFQAFFFSCSRRNCHGLISSVLELREASGNRRIPRIVRPSQRPSSPPASTGLRCCPPLCPRSLPWGLCPGHGSQA